MPEGKKTAIVVQCTYSDLGKTTDSSYYCIQVVKAAFGADSIILAVPDIEANHVFGPLAESWGVKLYRGSEFNVAQRLLDAADSINAEIIIRILLKRFYLDVELVRRMTRLLEEKAADYVNLPLDFNYEFGGDIMRTEALRKAAQMLEDGDSFEASAHRFAPWRFMEERHELFKVVTCQDVPVYTKDKVKAIKKRLQEVVASEDILYGESFPASRYRFVAQFIHKEDRVLDMACGQGHGSILLSERCRQVVGVDYSANDIEVARTRYGRQANLRFEVGDAHTFADRTSFDVVVSMHTMEHLEDDAQFLRNVRRNLREGGRLILEVPLLLPRPLGEPLYPFHNREYVRKDLESLVASSGFAITNAFGVNRNVYLEANQALEAIQLHCVKEGKTGG